MIFIQKCPYCTHTSIHHIRRRHHISPCLHMGKSCFCQQFQCSVIFHFLSAKYTAVSMRGVLTHTHICNQIHILFKFFLCFFKSTLHNTILGIGLASHLILMVWNTKKHDLVHPCFQKLFQSLWQGIYTIAVLSRHGRNFFLDSSTFFYKNRINKRTFVHSGFSYHFPKNFTAS